MTTWQKIMVATIVAVVLLCTCMLRYDMQTATPGGEGTVPIAYVLDRWTGNTYVLAPTFRRLLP